jgi:uncharacterized protein YcbK (DUF882 family)
VLIGLGAGLAAVSAGAALGQEKAGSLILPAIGPRRITREAALASARKVSLHNLHTGDSFAEAYYENGVYVPSALAEAQRVLRDWRNGEEHLMDPRLFDLMHDISGDLETGQAFQIISGYRSPKTNAAMHERSSGVASNSQHMYGKAVDVRIQGVELARLHRAALAQKAGGVGLYPVSNWVHIDTARVRTWTGA